MRFLREYENIAHDYHFCDVCCEYIFPGEQYKGIVYVKKDTEKKRIVIHKSHSNPYCEPPENPEDYRKSRKSLERIINFSLDKAA